MAFSTVGADLHIARLTFVNDEQYGREAAYFGIEHANTVSGLAASIGMSLGLAGNELVMCQRAGLLHDIARRGTWRDLDVSHAERSARMAVEWFQGAGQQDFAALGEEAVVRVARVIFQHRANAIPGGDPIAAAVHDADVLDGARFPPAQQAYLEALQRVAGGERGLEGTGPVEQQRLRMAAAEEALGSPFLKERYSKLVTPFAKDRKMQAHHVTKSVKRVTYGHGITAGSPD